MDDPDSVVTVTGCGDDEEGFVFTFVSSRIKLKQNSYR